jgi:hypothetical protein
MYSFGQMHSLKLTWHHMTSAPIAPIAPQGIPQEEPIVAPVQKRELGVSV